MKNQSFPGVPGLAPNPSQGSAGSGTAPSSLGYKQDLLSPLLFNSREFSSSSLFKGETFCSLCLPEVFETENGLKKILSFLGCFWELKDAFPSGLKGK